MLQLADDKKTLKQLEDKILKLLSESSGVLVDLGLKNLKKYVAYSFMNTV